MVQKQLAFDISFTPTFYRSDFYVSPANAQALDMVDDWARWPMGKLFLCGPAGSGKTHLAHIWAAAADALVVSSKVLTRDRLLQIAAHERLVLEDVDRLVLDQEKEEVLFHLHDMLLPAGRILFTSRCFSPELRINLADLRSRMEATAMVRITLPDDALLSAVLLKLFADRQIVINPPLLQFIVSRMERSIAAAQKLVIELDSEALAEGRPITRTMVVKILEKMRDQYI